MRPMTRWLLSLVLVLGLAADAAAQVIPGPGSIIKASRTSVTVTNSTAEAALFTYDIPAGFAAPLHLRLEGTLSTPAAATTINLSCNYGGANASLTLLNAFGPPVSATNIPINIDFRVRPTPTWNAATPVGVSVFGVVMASGSLAPASSSVVTSVLAPLNGTSQGFVNMNSTTGQTLACQWRWGGAASTEKILTIWQGNLFVGE